MVGSESPQTLSMLARAVEQSPSIVLITDRAGHIEYVNPRFTELTGYTADEAYGKTPRILKSGSVSMETYRRMWNAILSGEEWHSEILNRKRDGTVYWQRSAISSIRDESGSITHFLEVAEEITREKELEGQLFQSQKMEAVGQLAGGIAHDFNNMLTVIIGLTEMIREHLPEDGELAGFVQSILSAARKSSSLTHQLLAFSRRQILHPETLDVNVVVKDMEKMLRRIVGDNIGLVTRLHSVPCLSLLDQSQTQQVILNLVVNAAQSISGDGVVEIETSRVDIGEEAVELPEDAVMGPYVRLTVRDSGGGMDKETLLHLFEPFYTTKANGTGLGLSTVYGIVHQSRGHIAIRSEPGNGSTFSIYFPSAEERGQERRKDEDALGAPGGSETILVVEDNESVRTTINDMLVRSGYTVIISTEAEYAIAQCAAAGRNIDLLVTDIVLPKMDGVQLYETLRMRYPQLPVLYISGYAENLPALQREIDGGRSFLEKPFGGSELLAAVRKALAAGPGDRNSETTSDGKLSGSDPV